MGQSVLLYLVPLYLVKPKCMTFIMHVDPSGEELGIH